MRGRDGDDNSCSGADAGAGDCCWRAVFNSPREAKFRSFDRGSRLFSGGVALLFLLLVAVNAFVLAFIVVGRQKLYPLIIGNCFATGIVILLTR